MHALACFNLRERLMPHLRAQTAQRLVGLGLRQSRVAEYLGVSQAMVSKYLRGAPVRPDGVPEAYVRGLVERAVEEVQAAQGRGSTPPWCPLCAPMNEHQESVAPASCVRGDRPRDSNARAQTLASLMDAASALRQSGLASLAPEVQVNLAMAAPNATGERDVAAFPGRLVDVRGELKPVAEPEFGASHHLSQLLLRMRRTREDARAILCLRDGADVRRAARQARLVVRVLKRTRVDVAIPARGLHGVDVLVDPGAFGIEPILYVIGRDAPQAVEKAQRLHAQWVQTRRQSPTV